ncbi:hypothetical protein D3C76_1469940 [compost metagenome]
MAAEIRSIFFAVSDGISAAKVVWAISTSNPEALATAWAESTIMPWILLLFTSRNVNGTPVAVAPTLYVSAWATKEVTQLAARARAQVNTRRRGYMVNTPI